LPGQINISAGACSQQICIRVAHTGEEISASLNGKQGYLLWRRKQARTHLATSAGGSALATRLPARRKSDVDELWCRSSRSLRGLPFSPRARSLSSPRLCALHDARTRNRSFSLSLSLLQKDDHFNAGKVYVSERERRRRGIRKYNTMKSLAKIAFFHFHFHEDKLPFV
jgi:hypothetical protein